MISVTSLVDSAKSNQAQVNGKWVPARPINFRYRTFKEKLTEAWKVFTGEYDALKWPEGQ